MPPRPPPVPPIRLNDLYTIATTVARIAHRAAYLNAEAAQGSSSSSSFAGPSSPWPSQAVAVRRQQRSSKGGRIDEHGSSVSQSAQEATSLPPRAPDGTYTEMKHVNPARQTADMMSEDPQAATKRLDASLSAYFGESEPIAKEPEVATDRTTSRMDVGPTTSASYDAPLPQDELDPTSRSAAPLTSDAISIPTEPLKTDTTAMTPSSSLPEAPVDAPPPPPMVPFAPPEPQVMSTESRAATIPPETMELPSDDLPDYDATTQQRSTPMRASKVPSSRLARLMHYGSLGAGLAWGAAGSYLRPSGSSRGGVGTDGQPIPTGSSANPFMSEGNIKRLVDKLSRMRGAALKLGQFLSIQDAGLLPAEIESVLLQVQNSANYMPEWQMERVLREDLGSDWRRQFSAFTATPFAAASIGQVHHGVLSADHPTHPNMPVAIKVQFPGIRESIESDLGYLKWLLLASAILPKGLFLESTIKQMRMELEDECDYTREAEMAKRFGQIFNKQSKGKFEVPKVVDDCCGKRVLTMEMMKGRPLSSVELYDQQRRDQIATSLLHLALAELFSHRLMQTDPNFSNFLYSPSARKVQLIDFGATREYSHEFMDKWLRLLLCAVEEDREGCQHWSLQVGYLLGSESQAMIDAHVQSMVLLGSPFRRPIGARPFDFTHQTLTDEIKSHIPVMLAERKTPPPKETYSLNRKLSGTFLICSKLKAKVDCREILRGVVEGYRFQDGGMVSFKDGRFVVEQGSAVGASTTRPAVTTTPGARSYHTTSRILQQIDELRRKQRQSTASVLDRSQDFETSQHRRARRVRERYGINLGNRWPRSFSQPISSAPQDPVDSTSPAASFDTLAQDPAGTSMASTPSDSETALRRVEPLPAEQSSLAESPLTTTSATSTKKTLRGIPLPKRPPPPGPEDCCMSGCARCVYDLYKEDLEIFLEDVADVRGKLLKLKGEPMKKEEWDEDVLGRFPSPDEKREDDSTSAGDTKDASTRADEEVDQMISGLDPSIKAFLEMERKMKKKQNAIKK